MMRTRTADVLGRTCQRLALACTVALGARVAAAGTVGLADLGVDKVHQDWGTPAVDKSVDGHPLSIGGQTFDHGLGTHAGSTLWLDLHGSARRFTARVGVDDEVAATPTSASTA